MYHYVYSYFNIYNRISISQNHIFKERVSSERIKSHYCKLTVSFRTVMKLMWKFFLDSKSDSSRFKSDFVTLLSTPASSTTYDSCGGPPLSTSNSDANAELAGSSGQKLSAKDRARAATPWWTWENQLFGSDRNDFAE